ncbi:MAG: GNAT family N-acetyltransferase [Hyphomicrobiaceae bacterium]
MPPAIEIRAFTQADSKAVRDLFITVNRQLAPDHLKQAFEDYIALSLNEEIDCIRDYYGAKHGGFWVANAADRLVGMFGLEATSTNAMELRRMYVEPTARRQGIARSMLQFAESECQRLRRSRMILSTSELQSGALSLYRTSGYKLDREEAAGAANNRTVGGGIRRFHFSKDLL